MNNRATVTNVSFQIFTTKVSSASDFRKLEPDWKSIVAESGRPVPFLAWEWISTWWQHFGGKSELFVIVARDGTDRVVGIAPLHLIIRRTFALLPVRSLEFLGY